MKTTIAVALFSLALSCASTTNADTFGSGANSFNIEFVNIGNPGNAADTTGNPNPAGSVAYSYRMGKFDISEQMIEKANTLGGLGITVAGVGADKPATYVSWNEAARFVDWLNTSQGFTPAYKFTTQPGDAGYSAVSNIALWAPGDAGYNPANLYRNSQAHYFLPSVDEWYKAAYYDPSKNGGTGGYWQYPTGSNSAPTPVASGTAAGTAVYNQYGENAVPADITLAGGLSPYGTMAQGGNVYQWEESASNSPSAARVLRGGVYSYNSSVLLSSFLTYSPPTPPGGHAVGFRVASVAEPSGLLGDFNTDGRVDAADYVVWRKELGTTYTQTDYDVWRAHFGQSAPGAGSGSGAIANSAVPEPTTLALLMFAAASWCLRRSRAA